LSPRNRAITLTPLFICGTIAPLFTAGRQTLFNTRRITNNELLIETSELLFQDFQGLRSWLGELICREVCDVLRPLHIVTTRVITMIVRVMLVGLVMGF
jgi:hypothetical protein